MALVGAPGVSAREGLHGDSASAILWTSGGAITLRVHGGATL